MVKRKAPKRPNEFEYGMALYGVAWPKGPYYFVCGGGGHGLKNRIVWAQYRNGVCSDQIGEYTFGVEAAHTPMRMAMSPHGASLLVGMASGGIRMLQIGTHDIADESCQPKLIEVSVSFQPQLQGVQHEVSAMTFNHSGKLLAVGLKEGGGVRIMRYPSMRPLLHWKLEDPEVKDLDFMHVEGATQELLATVAGNGECIIWQLQEQQGGQGSVQQLTKLEPPKKLGRVQFTRCRFARDNSSMLYCLINQPRAASHIAVYAPGQQPGQPWQLLQHVQASNVPGSAFDISSKGNWVAAGDSDGDVRVFDAQTLSLIAQENVSIAFVSSVAFNSDNTALISVCGDANCHVLELVSRQQGGAVKLLLAVLLLALLVFGGALLLHYFNHPELLPYTTLQWLRQEWQQGKWQHACSAGSFPLHQPVCGWMQRAVQVLPPEHFGHDEL